MKKWETLLRKAMGLARENRADLYERVKVLAQVFDDPMFKRDMMRQGKQPGVFLNSVVEDTFTTFSELYAMIRMFPSKDQWKNGDLRELRASLRERINRTASVQAAPNGQRTTDRHPSLSWKKKYLDLDAKYKILTAKYELLEQNYKDLQRAIGRRQTG